MYSLPKRQAFNVFNVLVVFQLDLHRDFRACWSGWQPGSLCLCRGCQVREIQTAKSNIHHDPNIHDWFAHVSSLPFSLPVHFVSFAWNDCGDDVAVKLAEVLPQCQKLRRLEWVLSVRFYIDMFSKDFRIRCVFYVFDFSLESNSISTIGAEALARSLQSCPSVEVIR